MKKAHTPTEMSKGQSDNINNATKKFDYTAVADRLRTVSWSNYSHPTGGRDFYQKEYTFNINTLNTHIKSDLINNMDHMHILGT